MSPLSHRTKRQRDILSVALVLILFLLSVVVRLPFLGRPLYGAHDYLNLHTLLTIRLWNEAGLTMAHYAPAMNYRNPADLWITYRLGSTVFDGNGVSYFVAFPPFAFLLAFWVHQALHIAPNPLCLRLINVTLLLPATLVLYLLIRRTWGSNFLAVLGSALFLFNRAMLYSYGNLYFPIMLVVPIWLLAVFCFVMAIEEKRTLWHVGFTVACFLACYTSWLGYVGGLAFVAWTLAERSHRNLSVCSLGAAAVAGSLVIAQYSAIAGPAAFFGALANRFSERAGASSALSHWEVRSYHMISDSYVQQFGPLLLLLLLLTAGLVVRLWQLRAPQGRQLYMTHSAVRLLFCLGVPVAVEQLLLINHTAIHFYAVMDAAPLLAVSAVVPMNVLMRTGLRVRSAAALSVAVILSCCISTHEYLSWRNVLGTGQARLGEAIRERADPTQVVFLSASFLTGIPPNLL